MTQINVDINEADDATILLSFSKEDDETQRLEAYTLTFDQLQASQTDKIGRDVLIPIDIHFSFDEQDRLISIEILR